MHLIVTKFTSEMAKIIDHYNIQVFNPLKPRCTLLLLLLLSSLSSSSAEMRFLRRTAGYTRCDHKRNEGILTESQMSQITRGEASM
jgi:hypothetical protein